MGQQMIDTTSKHDRRVFLKRAAVVGWATPTILTMLATSAAASHPSDCVHSGGTCGVYSESATNCVPLAGETELGVCCEALSGENCEALVPSDGVDCICQ